MLCSDRIRTASRMEVSPCISITKKKEKKKYQSDIHDTLGIIWMRKIQGLITKLILTGTSIFVHIMKYLCLLEPQEMTKLESERTRQSTTPAKIAATSFSTVQPRSRHHSLEFSSSSQVEPFPGNRKLVKTISGFFSTLRTSSNFKKGSNSHSTL